MSDMSIVVSLVIITLASPCVLPVQSERILAIQTIAGKSHWNFMSAVLRALTDNGHEVTVFTPFLEGNRPNYTEIDMSDDFNLFTNMDLAEMKKKLGNVFNTILLVVKVSRNSCDSVYNNEQLKYVLAKDLSSNFDAIIIEPFMSNCMTYVAKNSNLPLIFIVPFPITFFTDRTIFGDASNPASVSPIMADHAVPRTFMHRFSNTVLSLYAEIVLAIYEPLLKIFDPKHYDLNTPVPPSLVFMNSHFISDMSRPTPSNAVNVGGIHLKSPNKIPEDILEFMEDSPHGIILFTFGSVIAISKLPENIQNIFIETLAQLPQRVLLKYEGELENIPKNVMTREWLPQRDILLHPNVKLFISHGGISGVYEAVDAGVPVLGFPLFSDQSRNIDNLVESGMAVSVNIFSLSKEEFFNNIVKLINNEKYKENAKKVSNIFKDRPMSPEKSVVYWTEYVIRHKGAPHLKSHAINLTWYQYYLLDVISVVLILYWIAILISLMVCKCLHAYYLKYVKIKFD